MWMGSGCVAGVGAGDGWGGFIACLAKLRRQLTRGAGAAYMGMGVVHPAMPIVVQACVRMLCALGVPFLWRLHSIMPLPPCAWV